jgi:hypothetical protein
MGDRSKFVGQQQPIFFRPRARTLSAFVALSCLLNAGPAFALTDIQGAADNLRVKAEDATIVEILGALSGRFKFTYTVRSHSGRTLNGTYSGTLSETLARVLDGNDYIVASSVNSLDIVVLGPSNATTGVAQLPQRGQITSTPATAASSSPASTPASSSPAAAVNPNPSQPTLSPPSPPPLSSYIPAASL